MLRCYSRLLRRSFCTGFKETTAWLRAVSSENVKHVVDVPNDDTVQQNTITLKDKLQELCVQKGVELPEIQTYINEHVRCLVKQRSSFHHAVDHFEDMLRHSISPELSTCADIIRVFCYRGEVDPAIHLLRRMSSEVVFEDCRPNTLVCNLVLAALSKKNERVKDMRELFVEMRAADESKPDSSSYSIYILGLCRAGRADDAMVVKKDMVKNRMSLNRFIYSALITGFCKVGQLDQAQKQLEEMIKLGVQLDVVCFTSLIDGLERSGKFSESLSLFQRMLGLGCKPDTVLSTRLMDCFICRGEIAQAKNFLQELLENGLCTPAMSSINSLVRRLCFADKVDEGLEVVKMMNEHGCNLSLLIYCDLITALCDKKRAREAVDVFVDAKLAGHSVESSVNPEIFRKLWGVKQTNEMLGEMVEKSGGDVCAYNFQLAQLDPDRQLKLLQQMIEEGISPDYQSYEIVIKGLCRAGHACQGYQVFRQLVASDCGPSSEICSRVVDAIVENDQQFEQVEEVLKQMIDDGYVPDDRIGSVITWMQARRQASTMLQL